MLLDTEITQELDRRGHWREADIIVRIAQHITAEPGNFQKSGFFGTYTTDFNKPQRELLKYQLGQVPYNLGVKEFKNVSTIENIIIENILCAVIGPIITHYTNLKTPSLLVTSNLSYILYHRRMFTAKMPGRSLNDLDKELPSYYDLEIDYIIENIIRDIDYQTITGISNKLFKIGIFEWDAGINNYYISISNYDMIKEKIIACAELMAEKHQYEHEYQKLRELNNLDLSDEASLFDFGGMHIDADNEQSPAYKAVVDFQSKIEPYINKNKLINQIYSIINKSILA